MTSSVSDDDALRALLSSAEAREREREQVSTKIDRRGKTNDHRNNGRDDVGRLGRDNQGRQPQQPQRRRRWGDQPDNNRIKRSRNDNDKNNDASYYGPSERDKKNLVEGDFDGKGGEHDRTTGNHDNGGGNDDHHDDQDETPPKPEYKPNFGLSGALAKDMQTGNVYKGVQLKFKEPPEARAPNTKWRFFVFKKGQDTGVLETLHISKQSAYLMGRNQDIADIPLLHPSLSGQHAVLQYRAVPVRGNGSINNNGSNSDGIGGTTTRLSCQPYIMDLESTNGTFLNGVKIDAARYYQLKKGDVLTFGASTREYVLMTENTTLTK